MDKFSVKVKVKMVGRNLDFVQRVEVMMSDLSDFILKNHLSVDSEASFVDSVHKFVSDVMNKTYGNRIVEKVDFSGVSQDEIRRHLVSSLGVDAGADVDVNSGVDVGSEPEVESEFVVEGESVVDESDVFDGSNVSDDSNVSGDSNVSDDSTEDLTVQFGISSKEQYLSLLDEVNDRVKAECDKEIGYTWCVKNARRFNCAVELYRNYSIMNNLRECLEEIPFEEYRYLGKVQPKYFKRGKRVKKD